MTFDFLKNIKATLANVKVRSMLVVLAVFVMVVLILVWTAFRRESANQIQEIVQTKSVRPMESLPGAGKPSVVYDPLQLEQNKKNADEALKTGNSAVPSLINQGPEGYGRSGFGDLGTGRCDEECYDADGLDKEGYDKEGYDKNGLDKGGFNRDGYNPQGYDRQGFDKNGFNKDGLDKNGFDKDGYDKDGYDRAGYDRAGFDRNGCNRQGFNKEGKPCAETVFDSTCFNKLGFDKNGCDHSGMKDGMACYNDKGFNPQGFNKCGFDKSCFNTNGLDHNNCDHNGMKNGVACYNAKGFNSEGKNACGLDENGLDADGFDKDGYDKDGYDKDGYDKNGFDKNGCNRSGLNKDGKPCYDAKGYTAEGFDKQGYDKNGYGRDGLDRNGFGKDGYGKDGFDKQGLDKDGYDRDGFNREGCNRQGMNRQGQPCKAPAAGKGTEADLTGLLTEKAPGVGGANPSQEYQRLLAEKQAADSARMAQLNQQQQEARLADQKARLDAFEALMRTQAQSIMQAWAPPTQTYVRGAKLDPKNQTGAAGAAGTTAGNTTTQMAAATTGSAGTLIQKAGDVMFGIIETSINSDQPGPVMARIVSGPLKGGKLLGSFQRQDKVVFISFSTLTIPNVDSSIKVDLIAIDPETARTALATGVDSHYLIKYGSLAAASFLQGMGQAVTSSLGTSNIASQNGATVASQSTATTKQQYTAGLGAVGSAMATDINQANIQPTVTVDSGTGIGLLVMSDLRVTVPAATDNSSATDKALAPLK